MAEIAPMLETTTTPTSENTCEPSPRLETIPHDTPALVAADVIMELLPNADNAEHGLNDDTPPDTTQNRFIINDEYLHVHPTAGCLIHGSPCRHCLEYLGHLSSHPTASTTDQSRLQAHWAVILDLYGAKKRAREKGFSEGKSSMKLEQDQLKVRLDAISAQLDNTAGAAVTIAPPVGSSSDACSSSSDSRRPTLGPDRNKVTSVRPKPYSRYNTNEWSGDDQRMHPFQEYTGIDLIDVALLPRDFFETVRFKYWRDCARRLNPSDLTTKQKWVLEADAHRPRDTTKGWLDVRVASATGTKLKEKPVPARTSGSARNGKQRPHSPRRSSAPLPALPIRQLPTPKSSTNDLHFRKPYVYPGLGEILDTVQLPSALAPTSLGTGSGNAFKIEFYCWLRSLAPVDYRGASKFFDVLQRIFGRAGNYIYALHKLAIGEPPSDLSTARFKMPDTDEHLEERIMRFVASHGLTLDRAHDLAEPIFENWQGLPVVDNNANMPGLGHALELTMQDNSPRPIIAPATGYPPQAFSMNAFNPPINTDDFNITCGNEWIAPGAMFDPKYARQI